MEWFPILDPLLLPLPFLPSLPSLPSPFLLRRVQYEALCRVTGALKGSSKEKINHIVNVEDIGDFLTHLQAS